MAERTLTLNAEGDLSVSISGREFSTWRRMRPSAFAEGQRLHVTMRKSRPLRLVVDVTDGRTTEVWALAELKGQTPYRPDTVWFAPAP